MIKRKKGVAFTMNNEGNIAEISCLVNKVYEERFKRISKVRRCTKCILTETMPFIDFDEDGVCNYCRNYQKIQRGKIRDLKGILKKYKKKDGKKDCIVSFSGGRDSSYALHCVKEELGMNPVAYSYDWGMMTDLGKRNQKLMTKKLGVPHIEISGDTDKKLENIRLSVEAWLKKPSLGMIPLFTAGDKQFFYYADKLKKELDIDLVIAGGNFLETTSFKTGFAGIEPIKKGYSMGIVSLLRLMSYYLKECIQNPSYINKSLFEGIGGFILYYLVPINIVSVFSYIKWDEKVVERVLLKEYGWETAKDTTSTWRIGDGTASFYNYIYYIMAGFTESETFRSNQIREGVMTRKEALKRSQEENKPRIESLIWYADTIGIDLLRALKIINAQKTLY